MRTRAFQLRGFAPALVLIALCVALTGCAAGLVATAGQSVLSLGEAVGMQAGEHAADRHAAGPIDEQDERCDTLTQSPPGVEEFRKDKDDTVQSRQWRLISTAKGMKWAIVRQKMTPPDGWEPKPGIAKLNFSPPLANQLSAGGDPKYLAYAPADTETIADSDQMTTVTEVFGPSVGTFQWHGRSYGYVLVDRLPCYKPLD